MEHTQKTHPNALSLSDTQAAFAHKSNQEIRFSHFIFSLMGNPTFVSLSTRLALLCLKFRLPVIPLIKASIFKQFCGGENLQESITVINKLAKAGIGSILDFSVEGKKDEQDFEATQAELLRGIKAAKDNPHIPFTCMKASSIARFELLEKISAKQALDTHEQIELAAVKRRLDEICARSFEAQIPLFIDAEESWIQDAIDDFAEEMMKKYNTKSAIVFNTLQMYRQDRLAYLERLIQSAQKENYFLGLKVVRGAYMEKEKARALRLGYPNPIHPDKTHTDRSFNEAIHLILQHLERIEVCAGTHNEESCLLMTDWMRDYHIPPNHPHIYFSQLYGMSDPISFNLAAAGFNVAKYLPYGPVHTAIPYLIRRAQENTAISGQMSKELKIIRHEMARRKKL